MELPALLDDEFNRRKARNTRYSRRAFARDLKLDPSHLSKILAGKRLPSDRVLRRIIPQMGNCDRVITRGPGGRARISLANDYADFLQWQNIAVLELLPVKRFAQDPMQIARVTRLTEAEVRESIALLKKLGFIQKNKAGEWQPVHEHWIAAEGAPAVVTADLEYQKQLYRMAIDACDDVPMHEKVQLSLVFGLKKSRIPGIRKKATAFRRAVLRALDAGPGENDDVYALCISLCPMRKREK